MGYAEYFQEEWVGGLWWICGGEGLEFGGRMKRGWGTQQNAALSL